jgi:hypothetical protein
MRVTPRIAALALAALMLAAPASRAAAAGACPPCCPDTPCEADQPGCEFLAATPCCGAAEAPPTPPARSSLDGPSFHPQPAALRLAAPAPPQAPRQPAADALAVLVSPLRLSVVLRI